MALGNPSISAAEQYLLELINRARLDPLAEAAGFGISLNKDLAAGTINGQAKQVLTLNSLLNTSATAHTMWMLEEDIFNHTGAGGSQPDDRMAAAGYLGNNFGENLALVGSSGAITIEGSIDQLFENLFLSAAHRVQTLFTAFREVGLGAELGQFTDKSGPAPVTFNAAALTENFGLRGDLRFVTGVAYQDLDNDDFYTMGEGVAGVTFSAQGKSAISSGPGGYGIGLTSASAVTVTGQSGALAFSLSVDTRVGNVKLDLVDNKTFLTSGNVTLISGVQDVTLLGVANLRATGSAAGNAIIGNDGSNILKGLLGRDFLSGGKGNDVLHGGRGNDKLIGGIGADDFVFGLGGGVDTVVGFSVSAQDVLHLDDALWNNTVLTKAQIVSTFARVVGSEVVFDFGVDEVHLSGLTTTAGLAALIQIL